MKHMRLVTWCAGLVGLLGLAMALVGLQCAAFPNGWMYVGVMLYVASLIVLVCLFVVGVLECVCGLHPLVDVRS